MSSWPWIFEDVGQSQGVIYLTSANPNAYTYTLDLDRSSFYGLMEKAARHDGYVPNQVSLYEVRLSDGTIITRSSRGVRTTRNDLIDSQFSSGSHILSCKLKTYHVPFNEIACSATKLVARKVRQLHLRLHSLGRLIFETSEDAVSKRISYGVRVEINAASAVTPDLVRTVQNTIRIVMCDYRPTVMRRTVNDVVEMHRHRSASSKQRNRHYRQKSEIEPR